MCIRDSVSTTGQTSRQIMMNTNRENLLKETIQYNSTKMHFNVILSKRMVIKETLYKDLFPIPSEVVKSVFVVSQVFCLSDYIGNNTV